ncbi:GntP family permease [Mesobacillus maritimus]|uniref:GntP family permease n=1 Tax=Mesobacillus maritimus TaxID=1643336 RepID=UPI00203D26EC|nr:gluconate:H+ symporter [Mesobacillus maritimus]MCM3585360.1 GntP family permease [Mesobacillus maritimus]MCM3668242.1 GntP family permease [Mesobacillus maritimus]
MLTGNALIVGFIVALILLFVFIIKFKWDAFISLLVIAIGLGLVSSIPAKDVPGIVAGGFGSTLTGVGILIGLGIIFGQFLASSGAISKIATGMLRAFGVKNSPYAMGATAITVSIPVFFDAAFIILHKLIQNLSIKTKISLSTFVAILAIGLITAHSLIIPTPGPLVVADQVGSDIGIFFIYGLLVAIPGVLVGGIIYGKFIGKKITNEGRLHPSEITEMEETKDPNQKEISTGLSFGMLLLPIVLILSNTVVGLIFKENPDHIVNTFFAVIGDKNVALLISVIVAMFVLKPYIKEDSSKIFSDAFDQSGMVILITGAGGAFGKVVQETGIGDLIIDLMQGLSMPALLLAFLFSQILRASLGSATVALVTTSAIMGPMAIELGVSPVLLGLAICAGGVGLSLPNDSGFWVVSKFGRLSMTETLKVWSIGGFLSGVTALIAVYILSMFTGILPGL